LIQIITIKGKNKVVIQLKRINENNKSMSTSAGQQGEIILGNYRVGASIG